MVRNSKFTTSVKVYLGAAASVLGLLLVWTQLDWPVPAFTDEIEAVSAEIRRDMATQFDTTHKRIGSLERFNLDTRVIVLGFEWERLFKLIQVYELKQSPTASDKQLLIEWRVKLRRVEKQLGQLNNDSSLP